MKEKRIPTQNTEGTKETLKKISRNLSIYDMYKGLLEVVARILKKHLISKVIEIIGNI